MKKGILEKLLDEFGQTYSSQLGIDLESKKDGEIFKWFLASILFGKRISESIAMSTYRLFVSKGVTTPEKISKTGWNGLVEILDSGGYVRYNFSTAIKLLNIMKKLKHDHGSLENLYKKAKDQEELEDLLEEFDGIGPVTINIFLRELRGIWNVDPLPQDFVILSASNLGFAKTRDRKIVLAELKGIWNKNKIKNKRFTDFEVALLRLGKNYCKKRRCDQCSLKEYCKSKL